MAEDGCIVKCPKCGNVIGLVMNIDGVDLLQMGGGFCHGWHGVCAVCGEGIHWSMSNKILNDLIDRVRRENRSDPEIDKST